MLERGKTLFSERPSKELAAQHNALPQEEKTIRLLARCGFSAVEIPDLLQNMTQHGSMHVDDELSAYFGNPVAQTTILLYRRAATYWKTGEAQALLAECGRGDITPTEWQSLYIDAYAGQLYLDHAA
ncbi:hypothetical protein EYC59_06115 [Candidatus Saccharibacteria bacterium]|nr:MAG: hypothetical protein EYC59_06115 [Candidatus Saccharibacteria bacterium]